NGEAGADQGQRADPPRTSGRAQASGQQDHLEHHETRSAEQAEIPDAVDEVGHEVYGVAFLLAGDVDGGLTGRTDTEGERTGDRVRVGGDHPPAHDIGAVVDLGGQFGDDLLVQRAGHDVDVGTGGVEDAHAVVDQVDRFDNGVQIGRHTSEL